MKNLELDDERKQKMRYEQKYNEEKRKAEQLEESFKNRETSEERRQREKEEQAKHKLEEL